MRFSNDWLASAVLVVFVIPHSFQTKFACAVEKVARKVMMFVLRVG